MYIKYLTECLAHSVYDYLSDSYLCPMLYLALFSLHVFICLLSQLGYKSLKVGTTFYPFQPCTQ